MKHILSSIFLLLISTYAFADLQVYPTRVYLTGRDKTATIAIKLRGEKAETYRISTMFYEMLPNGEMRQRPDLSASQDSASSYIRFSPKRVTLQPNVEQIVRLSLKKIKDLNGKELRTHLYFRPEEKVENLVENPKDKRASAFNLKAQVAIAVPVIIATESKDKVYFVDSFKVFNQNGKNFFNLELENASGGFLYGDFKVEYSDGEKNTLVAAANGVSSYLPKRTVQYPLLEFQNGRLPKGKYTLEFLEYSDGHKEKGKLVKKYYTVE